MKISRIIYLLFALTCAIPALAQGGSKVEVDYNNPKKYIVGGVGVEGNEHFAPQQILQITGLQEGMEVTVPSEELSAVVSRLWAQRFFDDVAVVIDSLTPTKDTAFFKIRISERPRVSKWVFAGVKPGEQKELQERLNLRRGGEFSEYGRGTRRRYARRCAAQSGWPPGSPGRP